MENPWASPWATAESDSVVKPEAAAVTSPEPPPAAFFSSHPTSNNISLPSGHSAWTEDESFGDWAAPEPTPSAAPSGWGIWGSGDTAPADGHLTPRLDRRRQGSNPQWPNSRSTSPGLRPPPLSKRSSSEHITLDPWASELSFNRRDDSELHIQHLPSLPTTAQEDFEAPPLRSRASNISIVVEPQSPAPIVQQNGTDDNPPTQPDSEPPSVQQDSTASPASSVSDGGGAAANVRSDSPITPAEEAPSAQDDEKTSSKVQKLVTMFDGIARKSSFTPELVPGPKRAVSQESTSRESMGTPALRSVTSTPAPAADGDQLQIRKTRRDDKPVEDTTPTGSEEEHLSSPYVDSIDAPESVAEPPSASLPEASPEEASIPTSEYSQAREVLDDATTGDAPQSIHHEPFKVDLEKMDELFTGPKSHVTGDDVTVPDRIITDSFEAISERKAWYRISRYGPMRQHNAGDDENYVRISWASSSIRPEIITTVRRWMEEDSMGGRTYRGASGKGSGGPAFGWNQPSTPVSLEEFFRRGRSGRGTPEANPRQSMSSLPPPNPVAIEQRPLSMPPSQAPGASAWSGLASFGWASESSTQPASPGNPTPRPGGDGALPSETNSFQLPAPPKKSLSPAPPPIQSVENDESDDEWGEMVTPSAPEFPSKPTGFGWETPAEAQRSEPPAPVTNGSGAAVATSQAKPLPFSGWNNAPLVPSLIQTKGTPTGDNTRPISQGIAHLHKPEEIASSVDVIPKSKPRKKVAFGLEESPSAADSDTATDALLAREFVSKLPDLSYMLR